MPPAPKPRRSTGEKVAVGIALGGLALLTGAIFKAIADSGMTTEQKAIRSEAKRLKSRGWDVKADHIKGYERPPIVNGRRPDIYAEKRGRVLVQEHETASSEFRRHSIEQDRDLRRWAARYDNVKYELVVTDD